MRWLAQVVGTGLVLLAMIDIYLTVLYPRGGKGAISVPLSQGIWQIFRLSARIKPKNRDRLLSYIGSTLLVATVAVCISLLIVGFALIFLPALANEIKMQTGATPTNFVAGLDYNNSHFGAIHQYCKGERLFALTNVMHTTKNRYIAVTRSPL